MTCHPSLIGSSSHNRTLTLTLPSPTMMKKAPLSAWITALRRMAGILQRDPVMLRFLDRHAPFRRVMARVNRVLMGGISSAGARAQAAALAAAISGAVIHPLVADLDDAALRSQLRIQVGRMLRAR